MPIDTNVPVVAPPSTLDLASQPTQQQATAPAQGQPEQPSQVDPFGEGGATYLTNQPLDLNPFGEGTEGISRYDSGFMQRAADVIDRDIEKGRRDASVALAEQASQRGTVGSSIEAWSQQEMLTNLETERMRRLTSLEQSMADAFAEDRATAANIALQQRSQQLQALGMDRAEAIARAQLEQQQSQFEQSQAQNQDQFQASLDWQRDSFAQQMGFNREQLAQQADQFTRMLADNVAQRNHEMGMLQSQQDQERWLQDNAQQFASAQNALDRAMQSREAELDRMLQLGLQKNSQEFQAVQAQLDRNVMIAQNELDRQHQMALQQAQQQWQSAENTQNRLLESRALDLQQQGMQMEDAWRAADRDLQRELETRAMDLQAQGMAQENAWRQALVELDRENLQFQRDTQATNEELARWDIWLQALIASAGSDVDISQYVDQFFNGGGGGSIDPSTIDWPTRPPTKGDVNTGDGNTIPDQPTWGDPYAGDGSGIITGGLPGPTDQGGQYDPNRATIADLTGSQSYAPAGASYQEGGATITPLGEPYQNGGYTMRKYQITWPNGSTQTIQAMPGSTAGLSSTMGTLNFMAR